MKPYHKTSATHYQFTDFTSAFSVMQMVKNPVLFRVILFQLIELKTLTVSIPNTLQPELESIELPDPIKVDPLQPVQHPVLPEELFKILLSEPLQNHTDKHTYTPSPNDTVLLTVTGSSRLQVELLLKSYVFHHYEGEKLPVLVIDNRSSDDSVIWMKENEVPHIALPENIGHMNAVNHALSSDYETVLLVDSDVRFDAPVFQEFGDGLVYANIAPQYKKWRSRIEPALCFLRWRKLKELGVSEFHSFWTDPEGFTLDAGTHFLIETKRLGVPVYPFPKGAVHYWTSTAIMGEGEEIFSSDMEQQRKSRVPMQDLELYRRIELKGKLSTPKTI